ncbi:MAG: SDR family oxidoreductase, partial [Patescibacteria group bacterium]|nr:SDR family oxidoreductase [Patescibacteria group bacterium]
MDNLLVSGCNGFIGSHLVKSLSTEYGVIGISNHMDKSLGIKMIEKNICKTTNKDISENIFCIIHLAAITDIQYCQKNPTECFEVNAMGTQKMLEIARKKDSKFIYVSTSHVY